MAWLKCKVTAGQFSSEYVIQGKEADGAAYSAFVPSQFIRCTEEPTKGRLVDGCVSVKIVDESGELRLVRLPRQTLENGQSITVTEDQLEFDGTPSNQNDPVGCSNTRGD